MLLTLAAATLAGLGFLQASLVVVSLMVGAMALGVADARSRAGDVVGHQRQITARQKAIVDRVESLERHVVKTADVTRAAVSASRERILGDAARIGAGVDRLLNEAGTIATAVDSARGEVSALSDAVGSLAKTAGDLGNFQRYAVRRTRDDIVEAVRNIDATLQLTRSLTPRGPLPPTGGWAITAQNLLLLTTLAQKVRPRRIVELGGGTSTVWLGYIAEGTGARMISYDHAESYARLTRGWLDQSGLGSTVELRLAPLEDVKVGGAEQPWYALSAFADLSDIDLLVIDGPPGATASLARYPALPLLVERLADEAWIVLDDAGRPDEQAAIARWLDELPGLAQLPSLSESLAILRFRRHEPSLVADDAPGGQHL